eukprot:TRINITY_DN1161_c5_g1_i2.p1 TRINITY_DN1161_c5_g1~~TRINITY_DN1161_c5_g1_i2.p1  ORF type:complete len:624 (+),score=168.52 TRINITY_DN1161_c5_g1_i2:66-1937(+)
MKTRFSSLDCAATVSGLQELVGMRLANVYDINPKTYILKLAKPDHNCMLLVESGVRVHTLDFSRDKARVPSVFALQLRKLLRTKRIEQVSQLGHDRIISFAFGSGAARMYLIVELYASGNVVACDPQMVVEAVLRPHQYADGSQLAVGAQQQYPMHLVSPHVPLDPARVADALARARLAVPAPPLKQVLAEACTLGPTLIEHVVLGLAAGPNPPATAVRSQEDEQLLLLELRACQELMEQPAISRLAGGGFIVQRAVAPLKAQGAAGTSRRQMKKKAAAAGSAADAAPVAAADDDAAGVLLPDAQQPAAAAAAAAAGDDAADVAGEAAAANELFFDEFSPLAVLRQYDALLGRRPAPLGSLAAADLLPPTPPASGFSASCSGRLLQFPSFMAAVAPFWGELDSQKARQAERQAEAHVLSKLQALREDQNRRLETLGNEQQQNRQRGWQLEAQAGAVDACLESLRNALATGIDWRQLEAMVKQARRAGDPLAGLVHQLRLSENRVTLALVPVECSGEEITEPISETAQGQPAMTVEVDLSLTAHANARTYFELARHQQTKAGKTAIASQQAIKRAEVKARQGLQQVRQQAELRVHAPRRVYWFEKFHWLFVLLGVAAANDQSVV